jgi:hypothetical protein
MSAWAAFRKHYIKAEVLPIFGIIAAGGALAAVHLGKLAYDPHTVWDHKYVLARSCLKRIVETDSVL